MKSIIKLAIAASLVAGAAAQPHHHQHRHQHAKKNSPVAEREVLTVYETEMATAYELGGQEIDAADAEAGIAAGLYFVAGESTPTYVAPSSTITSTSIAPSTTSTSVAPTSTTLAAADGKFVEVKNKAKTSSSSSTSTSSAEPSTTSTTAAAATSTASSSTTTGVDSDFPDGELDCGTLPTQYGAVAVTQLDLDGWASVLNTGGYTPGVSITSFSVATTGGPSAGMFGTYDCPVGYDMAQWPATSQGATGQSIGGLYCGTDNKLYLTRPDVTKKLCMKGAGGVYIVNKLSDKVSFCKTQYPGSEAMVLPTVVEGGVTTELYNPLQSASYEWLGSLTSAQYYVNLKGLDKDIACVWNSRAPYAESAGNWAGLNVGTSQNADGVTFLSVFHNSPTSTAALDFNIEVSGDISGSCSYDYSSNSFTGGTSNGCTVSMQQGGTIYITLSD